MKYNKYKNDTVHRNPFPASKAQDDQVLFSFISHNSVM